MRAFGLGKADRPADQSLDARPQLEVFTLDLLGMVLTNPMRVCVDVSLVSPPAIGIIARDAKELLAIPTICALTSGD